MSKVNLALIGCGGISDVHVSGYERLDNVNVLALCSKHAQEEAQRHADRIGSFQPKRPKVYADFREMLDRRNYYWILLFHSVLSEKNSKHLSDVQSSAMALLTYLVELTGDGLQPLRVWNGWLCAIKTHNGLKRQKTSFRI